MKMLRPISLALSLAVLAGCATESAGPGASMHADGMTGMPSASHPGPESSRILRFGDYSTIAVKPMGAPPVCVSNCKVDTQRLGVMPFRQDFDRRYFASRDRYSFMQEGPGGVEMLVHTVAQPGRLDAPTATAWFGDAAAIDAALLGVIEPPDGKGAAWRFVVERAEGSVGPAGWLVDDRGHRVALKPLAGPRSGFAFELGGQRAGSVDLLPPNVVWIRDDLAPDVRFALAGFSSAMLLRSSDH